MASGLDLLDGNVTTGTPSQKVAKSGVDLLDESVTPPAPVAKSVVSSKDSRLPLPFQMEMGELMRSGPHPNPTPPAPPAKPATPGYVTAPEEGLFDKIKSWWYTPSVTKDEAANVLAASEAIGVSPLEYLRKREDYNKLLFSGSTSTSVKGKSIEAAEIAMGAGIAVGMVTNPAKTLGSIGVFMGLEELENKIVSTLKDDPYEFQGGKGLADLFNAEGLSRDSLDLADFVWKAAVAGGLVGVGRGLFGEVVKHIKGKKAKVDLVNKVSEEWKKTGEAPDDIIMKDAEGLGIDADTLKAAHDKVIEMKDAQRELEPDMYDKWIKEDLSISGKRIEKIKQNKRDILDEAVDRASRGKKEKVAKSGMELIEEAKEEAKPEVEEPITNLDLQTGTREPIGLSTDASPFRNTPERTLELKNMYEERKKSVESDIELTTSKLVNDVNRYLDGEDVPINEVRNKLSDLAARADDFGHLFDRVEFFRTWKNTVSEAAKWARDADRLKNERTGDAKLYSGIPVDKIIDVAKKLKPFYSKLENIVNTKVGGKVEAEQLKKMLKNQGVSDAEINNLVGEMKGKVTKQEVIDEVKSNMTEFEDVMLGAGENQRAIDAAYYKYQDALTLGRPLEEVNRLYGEWSELNTVNRPTQFEGWVEEGAKPGSYRELFVTAPKGAEFESVTMESVRAYLYPETIGTSIERLPREMRSSIISELEAKLSAGRVMAKEGWQDGHKDYSHIKNPIVRLRYNEREVDGKKVLFIEEIQGPSDANQSLMPDYLQKRIYDIGVKRAIALAKEKGYDEIAWTTGEMQVDRYDLSKQIKTLWWSKVARNKDNIEISAYDYTDQHVLTKMVEPKDLADLIGKGLAERIINNEVDSGQLTGLDLKFGGEGLRYLYDQQIPSLMKKYGKGEVKEGKIETGFGGYRYEGPEKSIDDVIKVVRSDTLSSRIVRPAQEVADLMKEGKSFKEAIEREGTPALARLFGGQIFDVKRSKTIQTMSITEKTPSTFSMYSGLPIDEASRLIVAGAKRLSEYTKKARGMKEFQPALAAQMAKEEFNRAFVDRSGNIRKGLLESLGEAGYKVVQKMYLAKGASALSANMMKQLQKEVYDGLSKNEKRILDNLILSDRMIDIGRYKSESQFKFPEGLKPVEAAAYNELFQHIEGIDKGTALKLKQRAASYYEWMKKPLKDMLDTDLISQEEYDNLVAHNYRRLKLIDIFDKRYESTIGGKKKTVYDSGVQALAHGRETDIFEPSSEIMALEVFNRAYGRILNNEANKSLLELARKDKENPFARVKESKSDRIPTGWDRIFVFEDGERKSIYLSPLMSKEWINSSPEMSYKMGQVLRYASGSPVLRTFATGIDWGFALANLPRDIMHTWFTARTFEDGKWKPVYNPNAPIFAMQIGRDLSNVFSDAVLRKGRYEDYIKEGGGMEFLVHQGRLLQRGRHIEGSIDKVYDFLGYFGETSEIMTRLAIRDRVIRKRAAEKGISYEEAAKDKDISREATFVARDYMDFGQGGGVAKAADNAVPYLNASIQGTRGLLRAFKDNPIESTYKLSQFAALVTGLYIANNAMNPKTIQNLHGNIDMQNNLCIPLGDGFSFLDEKGQTRYPYIKIPLDPGQRFFKTFFEASTDKWLGNPVDADAVVNSLTQVSPVGTSSLPPTVSGVLGYMMNKNFWLNEDIWRKTDKPFGWPESKEEYIPGKTPQAYIDVGKATGLSPERTKYAVEQLVTSGSMWSWLVGKGYDVAFGDLPKDMKEKHLAEVISKVPVIKRFMGITNPYSQHAQKIDKAKEMSSMDRWVENRGLDTLVDGYLYKDNVSRKEVIDYIKKASNKDIDTFERLKDRFEFSVKIKDLPNRSFWLALKGIPDSAARAKVYVDEFNTRDEEGRKQLNKEVAIVLNAGGIISEDFQAEVMKLRGLNKPQ